MDDDIKLRIAKLTDEERELEASHAAEGLSEDRLARLHAVRDSLDQAWDLLRQRRARREMGLDPDEARPRQIGTVEGYEQ